MSTGATNDTPDTTRACNACGYRGPHVLGEPKEPHGPRIECGECTNFMGWVAKDSKKRRDRNSSHRYHWSKHYENDLICHWCLVKQSETTAAFDIDHILPLEDGGSDEMRNTRPLCADCHSIRHALVRFQRHLRAAMAAAIEKAAA